MRGRNAVRIRAIGTYPHKPSLLTFCESGRYRLSGIVPHEQAGGARAT